MAKRITLAVCLGLLLCLVFAGAAFAQDITVHYTIQCPSDCGGVIVNNTSITLPEGSTVFRGLKRACWGSNEQYDSGETPMTYSGSGATCYVSAINGATAGTYTTKQYDGWMYRVNDTLINYSCDDPTYAVLNDGDKVIWYYAEPETTKYTKIDSIWKNGSKVDVRVKEDHSTDEDNWIWQGFENMPGASVTLGYNGNNYTATTDANGVAEFDYQGSGSYSAQANAAYETTSDPNPYLPTVVQSRAVSASLQ